MAAPTSLMLNAVPKQQQDNHIVQNGRQNNPFVSQQYIGTEDCNTETDGQAASSRDAPRNGPMQNRRKVYRPIQTNDRKKPAQAFEQSDSTSGNGRSKKTKKPPLKPKRQQNQVDDGTKGTTNAQRSIKASTVEERAKAREYCVVCTDEIKFHAVGECNHHGICSKCFMRMRWVLKDRSCPICKTVLSKMIVSREVRSFQSFSTWGEEILGAGNAVDAETDMIFVNCRSHYQKLRRLRELHCRLRSCDSSSQTYLNIDQLNQHMKEAHNLMFCQLCLTHETRFIQECPVYTKAKLAAHSSGRNGRTKSVQNKRKELHPMCQFCKKRQYCDVQLFQHLEKEHYKCHLCKSSDQYYRDYTTLENHFRSQHYLCEDTKCLASRFVVFENQVEYHAHMAQTHGVRNPKVMLEFHVARNVGHPQASNHASPPEMWAPHEGERGQQIEFAMAELEESFPLLPTPSTNAPNLGSIQRSFSVSTTPIRNRKDREKNMMDLVTTRQGQIARNRRLAQAFGLSGPGINDEEFALELIAPAYPQDLVNWAKANTGYLSTIERRLERLVKEARCFNVSLKPMPSEERACMHELATIYGVSSESTGQDPYRRVVFYKRDASKVPIITVSTHLHALHREAVGAKQQVNPSRSVTEQRHDNLGENRGWERLPREEQNTTIDAWSDDEEKGEEVCTDDS